MCSAPRLLIPPVDNTAEQNKASAISQQSPAHAVSVAGLIHFCERIHFS